MLPNIENLCQQPLAALPTSRKAALAIGAKFYFTGRPCANGHVTERRVTAWKCVGCEAEAKPLRQQYFAQYRKTHREYHREYSKQHYLRNKERVLKNHKLWTAKNAERHKELRTRHRNNNRQSYRAAWRAEQAKRRAAGVYSALDIATIMRRQRGRCAYCRKKIIADEYEIDHIIPIKNGGTSWPRNLQITCPDCNKKKNAKDPLDYARSLGLLL